MKCFATITIFLFGACLTIVFASRLIRRNDEVYEYCANMSVKTEPIQEVISSQTKIKLRNGGMIGAPEVLQLGQNLIHLVQAKKAIDIGTFTGSSAVAWALAIPADGEVLTIDVDPSYYDISRDIINTRPDIDTKIKRHIGPALEKLDAMLTSGEAGNWDFIFIDADKMNYPQYYDRAVNLLRPGGIVVIDNALWGGRVANNRGRRDGITKAIDKTNQKASNDSRVYNYLINIADGVHVIFKKHTSTAETAQNTFPVREMQSK